MVNGGSDATGTAKRKREPSGVTPHSGITRPTAKRRAGAVATLGWVAPIGIDITVPSGLRKNNSRPSARHRGATPPLAETRRLLATVAVPDARSMSMSATNTSFGPASLDV